jgi:hypothetical protein
MLRYMRVAATLIGAGALLALPVAGQAAAQGKSNGSEKRCAKTPNVGYSVSGTLVSATADNPATTVVNEASVTLRVTGANSHARNSGEIADQDAAQDGVQVAGATYTVTGSDAFALVLHGYAGVDTPSAGDAVKVGGKIARKKKKCAPAGTATADRYAAPDVRRVMISDRDPDA